MNSSHSTNINEIMATIPAIYRDGKCCKILPHYPTGEDILLPGLERQRYKIVIGTVAVSQSPFEILRELDIPPNETKGRLSVHIEHSLGECERRSASCKANPTGVRAVRHGTRRKRHPFSGATFIICETSEIAGEVGEFLRSKYPSYEILTIWQTSPWGDMHLCSDKLFEADIVIATQSLVSPSGSQKEAIDNPRFAVWGLKPFKFPGYQRTIRFIDALHSARWDTIVQLHTPSKFEQTASYRNLIVVKDPPTVDGLELSALVLPCVGNNFDSDEYTRIPKRDVLSVTTLDAVDAILSEIEFPQEMVHRCSTGRQPLKSARSVISNQ